MIDELIQFLAAVAAEDLELARQASTDSSGLEPPPRTPVSWRWSGMTRSAAVPDQQRRFLVDDSAERDCRTSVCLESVERRDPYGLTVETIGFAQEVTAAAGAHIVRHDPAAVARRVAALEAVLVEARRVAGSVRTHPGPANYATVMVMETVLRALAVEHSGRAGYLQQWRPVTAGWRAQ